MKNKIAIASAFIAASSFSMGEIVVNDFLSFEGFVDMSYTHEDTETGNNNDDTENSYGLDQVEISWLFDFDPVTAQIDLQYLGSGTDTNTNVEQAFVTYHFDNGGAVTAGRYASMLGFEAYEPTGLYQFSTAYDIRAGVRDLSNINGQYANGVKFTYETDTTFFGISLQDEAFSGGVSGNLGGDDDNRSFGLEVAGSLTMENGLTFFLGGAYEDGDEGLGDTYIINTYATFETGAWIFAAELNLGNTESGSFAYAGPGGNFAKADADLFSALIMANFAYSDQASVTGRISYQEFESNNVAGFEAEYLKYTLAHGYAFTDNLSLVNEISYIDGERGFGTDYESLNLAAELIFSF
ncbi:MAG: hypothetical protein ACSHX4_02175 [Opitutaceae bacterium]